MIFSHGTKKKKIIGTKDKQINKEFLIKSEQKESLQQKGNREKKKRLKNERKQQWLLEVMKMLPTAMKIKAKRISKAMLMVKEVKK